MSKFYCHKILINSVEFACSRLPSHSKNSALTHFQAKLPSITKIFTIKNLKYQIKYLNTKGEKMIINTRYRIGSFIDLCSPSQCGNCEGNWTFSKPCQHCFPCPPQCPSFPPQHHICPPCDFAYRPNFPPCLPPAPTCHIDNHACYFLAGYLLARCRDLG